MAVLFCSVHVAGGWLCWQAAVLDPLFKHNCGTAEHIAMQATAPGRLSSVTERCQILDFPDGCWLQLGTSL